jgi:hypothetical protein
MCLATLLPHQYTTGNCVRHTLIIHSSLAWRHQRARAAIAGRHGLQALPIDALAARLAGGFLQPIDPDALKSAIAKSSFRRALRPRPDQESSRLSSGRGSDAVQGMELGPQPCRARWKCETRGGVPPGRRSPARSGSDSALASFNVPTGGSRKRCASAHPACPHSFRADRDPRPYRNVSRVAASPGGARRRDRRAMDCGSASRPVLASRARDSGRRSAAGSSGNLYRILRQSSP